MDTVIVADWLSARLDRSSSEPMYRQLLQLMQQAILTGELGPGTKLPSSRTLAGDLSIARNTVLHVYDQLTAEGYVLTTTGSGTYVADTRPDAAAIRVPGAPPPPAAADELPLPDAQGSLSMRGRQLVEHAGVSRRQWGAFMPGVPDVSEFPSRTWSRLQARLWKEANPELLTYAPGGGYRPLRRALADYLRVARSVKCSPDQVIITTGIHQSIDLAVRLLSDIGDRAWVEEPCYWGVRSVLQAAGLTLAPVPVDQEGLDPRASDMQHPPRLVLVTPSHQYPLGMPLSMARRNALLAWARTHRAWIVEDDYDSELRYEGYPFPSLQGLAPDRVIYLGTFSKILFPSLRLGYVIAPDDLVPAFCGARVLMDRHAPTADQHVLAAFIAEGHLDRHIRRVRGVYAEQRAALIDTLGARLPRERAWVQPGDQGMHVVLWLAAGIDDLDVVARAAQAGVAVRAVSPMFAPGTARPGLVLGFGGFGRAQMEAAAQRLADVVSSVESRPRAR